MKRILILSAILIGLLCCAAEAGCPGGRCAKPTKGRGLFGIRR